MPVEKGFFGWLKRLFGGAEPAPVVVAPAQAPAPVAPTNKTGAPEERSDGRRDNRSRGGRNATTENRAPREGREGGRSPRGEARSVEGRPEGRGERRPEGREGRPEGQPARMDGRGENREGREVREAREPREGRNGGRPDARRDVRREVAPTDANVPTHALQANAAPEAAVDTPETAEAQRRERRPRNDNRRRQPGAENTDAGTPVQATEAEQTLNAPAEAVAEVPREGEADTSAPRAPRERRSRDRYGRDRRDRAPRDASAGQAEEGTTAEAAPAASPTPSEPVRSSYFSLPVESAPTQAPASPPVADAQVVVPAAVEPVAVVVPEPRASQPAPEAVRTPRAAPAPVAAPVAGGLPKVQTFALSIEALHQVAQSSGLEWVNSNADKVAQVQAAIAAEPKPVHVPREPKIVVLPDDGPLVLVETRKDLRNMPLPFEVQ